MPDAKSIILIVDDEEAILDIIGTYLEIEGYAVEKAENGRKALEILNVVTPDLIISDISMPEISGIDLYDRVRNNPAFASIPFIFLTGHSDHAHIRNGKELGCDDYITKPFDGEILISTVRGKLKRRRQLLDSMSIQVDQIKNQLFQLMSHEFRTPLTSILGATEVLTDGKESLTPGEFKDFLQMLQAGSHRLNNMVEDFLLVMKIESGEAVRERETKEAIAAPRKIIQKILLTLASAVRKEKILHRLDVTEKILQLDVYLPHLENILYRILDNAVKFNPADKKIIITDSVEQNRYNIHIRDEGPGIPKKKQEELFQKFNQVNRSFQEQQGVGLGLYIAKKLCDINNCTLSIASDYGTGTTVTVAIGFRPS